MAKGIKLRNWSLDARDYETDDSFRAAVELELARFEHIGERFGVALVATPVKQRIGNEYVTAGWHFATATVPAVRETAEPEPISDEELEALEEAVAEVAPAGVAEDPYAED